MVDEVTEKPLELRDAGGRFRAVEPYNLRRKPRCRPAGGAAGSSHTGQPQVAGSSGGRAHLNAPEH